MALLSSWPPNYRSLRTLPIGLALDISPPPTKEELAAAMERYVVIRIVLDQANSADPG